MSTNDDNMLTMPSRFLRFICEFLTPVPSVWQRAPVVCLIITLLCACAPSPLPTSIMDDPVDAPDDSSITPQTAHTLPDAPPPALCANVVTDAAADPPDSTSARNIEYIADDNTIMIRKGPPVTLATISQTLGKPELLQESAPGEWSLTANLQLEEGATLHIAGPEVKRLKLHSTDAEYIWIKAFGGRLEFIDTCVTSWDSVRNDVDTNYADGRSFVLARNGAHMSIRGSEMSYLGYDAYESYGVAWRLVGTSGEILNSRLGYNYYGLYTYEVSDLVILDNEVHHSIQYGIDPHTRSHRLRIENNLAHHNGKHGIILAEECRDSVIRNNTVFYNNNHGIVLFKDSNRNLVEDNTVYGNGLQGINVNNSADNTIRYNTVYDNLDAGIGVGQDAHDNVIHGNETRTNRQDGIYLFSDAEGNVLSDNTVSGNARYGIYIKSEDNKITAGNLVHNNTVGVYLNVDDPPDVSQDDNRIYDNREADVVIDE